MVWRVLAAVAALVVWCQPLLGVEVDIHVTPPDIVVQWPTNASGFRLQVTQELPPTNGWVDATEPVGVSGDQFVTTNSNGSVTHFFRLIKPSGTAPILASLTVSTNLVTFTNATTLSFSYADSECDIVDIQITVTSPLGVSTQVVAASLLDVDQVAGTVDIELVPLDLIYGVNNISIQLIDAEGRMSSPANVDVVLFPAAFSGSAPQLTTFEPETPTFQLPGNFNDDISRLRPRFQLALQDADGDLERIRFTLRLTPNFEILLAREYSPEALGLTSTGGVAWVTPVELTSSTPAGDYVLSCQVFDAGGNALFPSVANYTVQPFPRHPVQVTAVDPLSGRPGTVVRLTLAGIDAADTNAFTLTLGEADLPVLTNELNDVLVEIPVGATSGRVTLRSTNLVVASASTFTVDPYLVVDPVYTNITPDTAVAFAVAANQNPTSVVEWLVDEIPGGAANVGTITTDGWYQPPAQVVSNRRVTVRAVLQADTNIYGLAALDLEPPPGMPGSNEVFAASGGQVLSRDGGALLLVPPAALNTDTALTVARLTQDTYPTPPSGQRLLAAVELGPDGQVFNEPVSITFPLNCHCPPGSVLPVREYDPGTGTYIDEGLTATVSDNGVEAVALVPHFSTFVVIGPDLMVGFGPNVSSLTAGAPLEEGREVPVLLTGTGLSPDTVAAVHEPGVSSPAPGFHVDSWLGLDTNAGCVITIPELTDLDEGQTRNYELRLVNFSQPSTSVVFTVVGLDHLIVPAGTTLNFDPVAVKTWSSVTVEPGAVARASTEKLDWRVTTSTRIEGTLDAGGAVGADGSGINGGPAGRNGGGGMRGADDRFAVEFDPEPAPGDGDRVILGGKRKYPQGQGGRRGSNRGYTSALSLIGPLMPCNLPITSGDCADAYNDLFQRDRYDDFDYGFAIGSMPAGWIGFGAPSHSGAQDRPWSGHGGGGGGGSGDIHSSLGTGAGGGAGGDGGLGVRIVSRNEMAVAGLLTTEGGRGGQGASAIDGLPLAVGDVNAANLLLSAGGGGGGSAGEVIALGGSGVFSRDLGGAIRTEGGTSGDGGLLIYDASEANAGRPVVFRDFGPSPDAGNGNQYIGGAPFSPATLRDTVTDRSLLQLTERNPLGTAPLEIEIQGSQAGQVRIARVVPANNPEFETYQFGGTVFQPAAQPPYQLNLVLFPGFNTIAIRPAPRRDIEGSIANPIYELLFKRILSLPGPDSDGDGLSDADEADLGTDPNEPDSDMDGTNDGDELLAGDDPLNPDSDGDFVFDSTERTLGTSPRLIDSDADQIADGVEWILGSDPLTLPPGSSQFCPITNGPPAGALFAQIVGQRPVFRLAMLDLANQRGATIGFVDPLGFPMAFKSNGDLLFGLGDRLVEATPAFCYLPFNNFASRYATTRSGQSSTGASIAVYPGTPFVGGILFGPQVGARTVRIDPLATDPTGQVPLSDITMLTESGTPVVAGSIDYQPGGNASLIGTVLDPSGGYSGQLFSHKLPQGPTRLLGQPFNRDLKTMIRFVNGTVLRYLAVAEGSPSDELVEVTLAGGPNLVGVIGPLGYDDVRGLAQHPNGQLYASAVISGGAIRSSEILLVDPTTAGTTAIATYPKDISHLAFAPCPAPCFGPPMSTPSWPTIRKVVAVDFDQDGDDDLALLGAESAASALNTLVIMESDGTGQFQVTTNHVLGGALFDTRVQIEVADLNNDSWPDLVCKNPFYITNGVYVVMNDGAGSYPAAQLIQTAGGPVAFDIGELTGDAYQDLLVGVRGSVQLYPGTGTGTFLGATVPTVLVANDDPVNVAIGDLDTDGLINDYIVTAFLDQRSALNNGVGAFTEMNVPAFQFAGKIELADFTGDGLTDAITPRSNSEMVVYAGDGAGGFQFASSSALSSPASTAPIGDYEVANLDRDSLPDIAILAPAEGRIHLWLNDRGTGFTAARQSPIQVNNPVSLAVGDFDGNGAPDLAVSEGNSIAVMLGGN